MKIGLLIYGTLETLSGGYLYDRELVKSLRARGESVEIISLPWRNYPAHLADNLRFRLLPGLDVLIEDELNHPSLLRANAGRHPYPVVSLVHHLRCSERHPAWLLPFYRAVERSYLRSVDAFIYNSQTTRRVVQTLVGKTQTEVVATPPVGRFGPGLPAGQVSARAHAAGPLRVLFLGNLIPRKGLQTLLEALRQTPPEVCLDVVGSLSSDPVHAVQMQSYARISGLNGRVAFHGALEDAALAEMLASAHVLAVPSSYEGFGIVYLEGMGFGLPAIGSTNGAASEVISAGRTGFLVQPAGARDLAAKLAELAGDRSLLEQLSLNALARYRQQPTWEHSVDGIHALLRRLVGIAPTAN